MKRAMVMAAAVLAGFVGMAMAADTPNDAPKPAALSFTMKSIEGKDVDLSQYLGKVVMMVNVASKCGFTPQYSALEDLYKKYEGKGFVILGFPANNFKSQEPGTDAEILQFCTGKYHVTFPMFSKISVKGEDQAPLYKYLTSVDAKPEGAGDVKWNFEKFLIGRDGKVVARFPSKVTPESKEITEAVEGALAK
ncbi:MAG: glutathione peroxidase [Phycisphaerae bacterium]